ncbi:acyl-CoA dehydrogenase family protein [Mycolicibacterium grossiae]|uniref:Acyl-CoA dehydrogenase n=1 Tax=Mycolicibacterium grossiae TaxID=1552759 RepID=A0A1E8Q8V8_9MYCO|nr:acyl-CoA dehydrogenase family protein [Mycolicibacterium grossiae]OFJ54987.1 acyl-CoA dehydrogenase [Mycolicibacterium grossiae]
MSGFEELHDELRAVARDVLGTGDADWARVVDAGWTGLEVPDHLGGADATFAETAVVLEECGRAASPVGLLGVTLAVGVLTGLPDDATRDDLLARIANGATACVAPGFGVAGTSAAGTSTVGTSTAGTSTATTMATGTARFVPDAPGADVLLLVTDDAVLLADGAAVSRMAVVDPTRSLASVDADGAAVLHAWSAPGVADRCAQRAAVAVACDSLGVAEAMLARTVDYASVRHQFGRPIGSFQAVKHACADMLVGIRVARRLVADAVAGVAAGADAGEAAAMAKSYTTAMAVDVAGKAMQLHGGIGYTWESGIHLSLKRAALNRVLFGSPAEHRRTLAARYADAVR